MIPDDDKCFLRVGRVIYTVIRIVAPDFPCRWRIMTGLPRVYVSVRWFLARFPWRTGERCRLYKKGVRAPDDYNVHKHPAGNGYGDLGEAWRV